MRALRLRRLPSPAGRPATDATGGVFRESYDSPVGVLRLTAGGDGLQVVRFTAPSRPGRSSGSSRPAGESAAREHMQATRAWLDAYFAGLPLPPQPPLPTGATPLQQRVWDELDSLLPGDTVSFGALARRLRLPTGPVVAAVGVNPVPVLRGSHRVYGWEGDSTGYSGGLRVKQWLLLHEQTAYR